MKHTPLHRISALLLVLFLCFPLTGCGSNNPPKREAVESHFWDNWPEIQTIVDFMVDSGYEDVYIMDASGEITADLEKITLTDETVLEAISALISDGNYYSISKSGNTIHFVQWWGIKDINCGVAYSINHTDPPEVQFCTTLTPLIEPGWYYYVADYEKWRSSRT